MAFADCKGVHLWLQSNKLDHRVALSLVLEEADFAFVGVVGETEVAGEVGRDFAKVEQAAQLRHVQQLFVEFVGEELKNQRVCVCV